MGSLKLQSVRKSFGDFEALKGIDLDITDGEFVVFVGPSGCGKSTLLRMIAGLEEHTAGHVLIASYRWNGTGGPANSPDARMWIHQLATVP